MAGAAVAFLAAIASSSTVARTSSDCLANPRGAASSDGHWYYKINRATHRKCWFVDTREANARRNGKHVPWVAAKLAKGAASENPPNTLSQSNANANASVQKAIPSPTEPNEPVPLRARVPEEAAYEGQLRSTFGSRWMPNLSRLDDRGLNLSDTSAFQHSPPVVADSDQAHTRALSRISLGDPSGQIWGGFVLSLGGALVLLALAIRSSLFQHSPAHTQIYPAALRLPYLENELNPILAEAERDLNAAFERDLYGGQYATHLVRRNSARGRPPVGPALAINEIPPFLPHRPAPSL
jgi:hypothetical protein